jgi:hypothetical protein
MSHPAQSAVMTVAASTSLLRFATRSSRPPLFRVAATRCTRHLKGGQP